MKKRIISIILVLAMVVSLVPAMAFTASALNYGYEGSASDVIIDTDSIDSLHNYIFDDSSLVSGITAVMDLALSGVGLPSITALGAPSTPINTWLKYIQSVYSAVGYGKVSSQALISAASMIEDYLYKLERGLAVAFSPLPYPTSALSVLFPDAVWGAVSPRVSLIQDSTSYPGKTILRPWFSISNNTGFYIVDGAGGFPYAVVDNPGASATYTFYNYSGATVNDNGLVSVAELGTFLNNYPFSGNLRSSIIQIGNYSFVGITVGSATRVLCKVQNGVYYAIHSQYQNQTPTDQVPAVVDTGFQTVMDNYDLDFVTASRMTNYLIANQYEFQTVAALPYTSVVNLDIVGSDGTEYPYYALAYGSQNNTYHINLQKGTTDIPSSALFYYKHNDVASSIFKVANAQLGKPYHWGGVSPSTGFDCSGLVKYVLRESGALSTVPDYNADQIYKQLCTPIAFAQAVPGDLVAFTDSGAAATSTKTHIGIYAGAGMMIVAPGTGGFVKYQPVAELNNRNPSFARLKNVDLGTRNLVIMRRDEGNYAADDGYNYFLDSDTHNNFISGDTTNNTKFIDNSIGTIINISGGDGFSQSGNNAITLYLDDLIYDESTKTYSSYSHSGYELSNGDNYITVNYNYEYNFYIDYTSITYIGTTADANETYNFYYELPDGRSSADLSGEDLLALNTQIDVIPYSRSSDDTSLRSLYHFNGNTVDSSYWNLQTDFTWNDGASITYLDAGQNFQGALYLDELDHDFTITLPSSLGSGDFTFEFRYYQSYTAAPQTDSYIMFGDNTLLQFDGAHYKNSSGTTITDTSIGNWNALCLMRSEGTLYFFVNGVPYSLGSYSAVLPADITFHFGSSQQTYKQIDELRVVNRAVYSTSGYTPASTQFDTNLSLVLPGTATPVADEYWDIDMTGTNLLSQYDLDWWDSAHTDSGFYSSHVNSLNSSASSYHDGLQYTYVYSSNDFNSSSYSTSNQTSLNSSSYVTPNFSSNSFCYFDRFLSFSINDYSSISFADTTYNRFYYQHYNNNSYSEYCPIGLILPLFYSNYNSYSTVSSYFPFLDSSQYYTFSMVSSSGEVASITFKRFAPSIGSSQSYYAFSDEVLFNGYLISYFVSWNQWGSRYDGVLIRPTDLVGGEFVYLALEVGSTSTVSAEFVSSIVPIETSSLNTPTLAVRTDIDITSWNIGGVRPSIPEKSMAWALVEDGIITSLQLYDGQGWTNVDGRIWTGERFVPLGSYNVLTMNDLLDIIGNSPGYTPIYTENGFWKWLQGAWQDMITLLTEIRDRLSGDGSQDDDGGGGHWWDDDADSDSDTDDGGLLDLFKTVLRGLIKVGNGILGLAFDGLESLVDWIGGIGDFFGYYSSDSPNNIWQVPVEVTATP